MTRLGVLLCLLIWTAACAQQVGDIDRTQPNGLQKSSFDGEWYYQGRSELFSTITLDCSPVAGLYCRWISK